jgi:hypothetical protein
MGAATALTPTANQSNPRVMLDAKQVTKWMPKAKRLYKSAKHESGTVWWTVPVAPHAPSARIPQPKVSTSPRSTKSSPKEARCGAKRTAEEALKKVTEARKVLRTTDSAHANQRNMSFLNNTEHAPDNNAYTLTSKRTATTTATAPIRRRSTPP